MTQTLQERLRGASYLAFGDDTNDYTTASEAADRIDALERALRDRDVAVQEELYRICNAYAKDGNMAGATAIHDAAKCLAALTPSERKDR